MLQAAALCLCAALSACGGDDNANVEPETPPDTPAPVVLSVEAESGLRVVGWLVGAGEAFVAAKRAPAAPGFAEAAVLTARGAASRASTTWAAS